MRWRSAVVVLVLLATAGCSKGSAGPSSTAPPPRQTWSTAVCTQVAGAVAWSGKQALLHYRPPLSTYPPDVSLLRVRLAVQGLDGHGCQPRTVGVALSRKLTPKERAELFTHLPPYVVRYLRRGLADA